MGTKRVGWARIRSLINENGNQLKFLKHQTKVVTAATTLTASESGTTVYWTHGTLHNITLPAATVGTSFRFIIAAGANAVHEIKSETDDKIFGKVVVNGHAVDKTDIQVVEKAGAVDDITLHFHSSAPALGGGAGDVLDLYCGEAGYWIVQAHLTQPTGATPADIAVLN